MSTPALIIACLILFIILSGVLLTRLHVARRNRNAVRQRLEGLLGSNETAAPLLSAGSVSALKESGGQSFDFTNQVKAIPGISYLENLHERSGIKLPFVEFINVVFASAAILASLPLVFDFPALTCLVLASFLLLGSFIFLKQKAESCRNKFLMQLPNAIDLMVSILRSGHSIPQSVRSVAEESPAPLGDEFIRIFHRMNLGQSLSEALESSVQKYDSFELDLLRRASALNQELGGSLAEVLEKTNQTLRQRIKLKNQVGILTAQGKLSAIICGLLPLIIAFAFSQINPVYLQPLLESSTGKLLLAAALVLELSGFLIMRKLSSFRI